MQNGQFAQFILHRQRVPVPDGKVQAQLGPEGQEIGGFWLGAASALKNASLDHAAGTEPCTAVSPRKAAVLIDAA